MISYRKNWLLLSKNMYVVRIVNCSIFLLYFLSFFSLWMSIEIRRRPSFLEESSNRWVLASIFFFFTILPFGEVLFVIFRGSFASFSLFILFKRFIILTMNDWNYFKALNWKFPYLKVVVFKSLLSFYFLV